MSTRNIKTNASTRTLLALALFWALILSSPAMAADEKSVGEEIKEAADAIGAYTVEQKDTAVAKAEELINDLDNQMNEWEGKIEANWNELKESSQENYRKSLRELREQRNDLSEWLGSMKHSSKEAWREVKQGFSETYGNVLESFRESEDKVAEEQ